jgi:hypothetical protein
VQCSSRTAAILTLNKTFLNISGCRDVDRGATIAIAEGGLQIANLPTCGLTNFVRFADLPQMWQFVVLRFADQVLFADLKLPQNRKNVVFFLTNIDLKCSDLNLYKKIFLRTSLRPNFSWFASKRLPETEFSKQFLHRFPMVKKLEDFKFADWNTKEICGLSICVLTM